jgi:asparagine synthase (glutamine-hydrolysing)
MCGILFFSLTTKKVKKRAVLSSSRKLSKRGPDVDSFKKVGDKKWFGFNRLSINDLSENGNQPFTYSNITTVCNGEIYNHQELRDAYQ